MPRKTVLALVTVVLLLAGSLAMSPGPSAAHDAVFGYLVSGRVIRTGTTIGIPGVTVSLYSPGGLADTQTTDQYGRYTLRFCCYDSWGSFTARVVETNRPGFVSTSSEFVPATPADDPNYWYIPSVTDQNADMVEVWFKYYNPGFEINFYDRPNSTPETVAVVPPAGWACAGIVQPFVTLVSDVCDASNIETVDYLFDAGAWMADAVYLRYDHSQRRIYLRNEANNAWLGGFAPGAQRIIENGHVRVHVADCTASVLAGGKQLQVIWMLEFLPAFAGSYNQFLYVANSNGRHGGFDDLGDWQVQNCGPLSTPTPTPTGPARPTPTATATPLGGKVSFRQGIDDYAGARETYIESWEATKNHDADTTLIVRANDMFAGLLRFDLSALPRAAIINDATLSLYAQSWQDPHAAGRTSVVSIFEVFRPWVDTQTTWNLAASGQPWGAPGCNLTPPPPSAGTVAAALLTTYDRAAYPLSSGFIGATEEWYDWHITGIVQKWVRDPQSNNGLVLKSFGETNGIVFAGSKHGGSDTRPILTIDYSMPTTWLPLALR